MKLINVKVKLIHKFGTNIMRIRLYTNEYAYSKSIMGRASSSFTDLVSLEVNKQGIFLPDFDVLSGDIIINDVTNEKFIVCGIHNEFFKEELLSKACAMLKCDSEITIKSYVIGADERGNIINNFETLYENIPCYILPLKDQLKAYESGVFPETTFRVYTTTLDLKQTDKLFVKINDKMEEFKILSKDYLSHDHIVILDVVRDIRE